MRTRTKVFLWVLLFFAVFVVSALLRVNYLGSLPMKLLKVDWNDSVGVCYSNLTYENNCSHKYDLYIPSNLDKTENQSLILFIHGGSFNSGDKKDGDAWCKFYTSKGYISATVNYSLQTKQKDASLITMDNEIKNCVSAIKTKCQEFGYNVTEMATCGVSAGGTLAMNYAYKHFQDSAIPVKFVFQLAGPADFEPSDWGILKKVNKLKSDAEFATMMTGVEITAEMIANGEHEQYIASISPARLVSVSSPPSLIGYGLKDHLVPAKLKFNLIEALKENNVKYDYFEMPNSNHGLYGDIDILKKFIDKSFEYCNTYFENK